VLNDHGSVANVQRLITQLNERAKRGVEEDERRKKRKNAVSDNNRSAVDTMSMGQREVIRSS
jgi:hypothetical protein